MLGEGRLITPRTITRFWLRRLCEAALVTSVMILLIYAWARFIPTGYAIPIGMAVSDLAAGIASIVSVLNLAVYFWLPQKHLDKIATACYFSIVILIAVLIVTSGGVSSPFISTWLLVAIFSGFFGTVSTAALGVILLIQVIATSVIENLETTSIITYLLFGTAPLILSLVIWHRQPSSKADNSIKDLASKLSTVEGKSDVVINTIDDGVMAINHEGIIDLINPSAQTLVGWSQGDALGLDWRSVLKLSGIDGRDVDDISNPIAQSLASNKPTHADNLYIVTQGGKKRLISIVSSPVGNSKDGVIVVFRDITKEKAEEREQAEFISTASHEMRTPVASIEGYLGLALNPATANIDEKARDFITKAHDSAKYLGRLFQDLLDISKAEEGLLKNEPQVVDVSAETENIFESLTSLAEEKGLRYIFKPNPASVRDKDDERVSERRLDPVYYAHIDPHHFRELISNLIENAIKYTPSGDVTVDVTGDSEIVTVSVKDTGVGIPAEDIPHLFQKFYRVDNSDTREIGGTGLGLFLCRRLAEIMGGHLKVDSVYKEGSTFYFESPRMSHEEAVRKLEESADDSPQITPNRQTTPIEPAGSTHEANFLAAQELSATPQPQENPIQNTPQPAVSVESSPINFSSPQASPIADNQKFTSMTLAELESSVRTAPRTQALPLDRQRTPWQTAPPNNQTIPNSPPQINNMPHIQPGSDQQSQNYRQ